ncbi:MAG: hypothetical protein WBX25_29960 [Rhodomicrobium sp.]
MTKVIRKVSAQSPIAPMSGVDYLEDGPHGRRVTADRPERATRVIKRAAQVQAEEAAAAKPKIKRVRTPEERAAADRAASERHEETRAFELERAARRNERDPRPVFPASAGVNITRLD